MFFSQVLEIILYIPQVLFLLGLITWLILVGVYYRHRAEQYWCRFRLIPKEVRDELYKVNPLRTEEDNHNRSLLRVLFHRRAFYEAVDKPEGERGSITFSKPSDASYLFECRFKAYRSIVRGTHEKDDKPITWLSLSGVTGLLSKLFGDQFKTVLKGSLLFCEENKDEQIRNAHFKFTGEDVPSEIKWNRENCDLYFLERVGMLVLIGKRKNGKSGFAFFFRCLPNKFYFYQKAGYRNKFKLRFNNRLFVNILIFYGWKVKFFKDYSACKEYLDNKT